MVASFLQRCSDEEKQAWSAAAKGEGVSLAGWVRLRLNAALTGAAHEVATPDDMVESAAPTQRRTASSTLAGAVPVRAKPKPSQCPHGLPKGFCLNPRCK